MLLRQMLLRLFQKPCPALCCLLCLLVALHAGAQPAPVDSVTAQQASQPLTVVATFSILADLVAAVGGEHIDLHVLVGPDSDGHLYQPRPADSRLLRRADLIFSNGLGFEGWIERLIRAAEYQGEVVVASAGIAPLLVGAGAAAEPDPHAWQSIDNVRHYIRNISAALRAHRPGQEAYFAAREAAYLRELQLLDQELQVALASLPATARTIVTSHDAFAYFGAAYQLRFIAPVGINTDSEASAGDVAQLIRQIISEDIQALFVENITDPRLLKRITSESQARIGGVLYSDALSPPEGPAATYLALMRHNLYTLMAALLPPVPENNEHD